MITIGSIHDAALHGLPGLNGWAVRAYATVLDTVPTSTSTCILLGITSPLDGAGFTAAGLVSTTLNAVEKITTDGLQPTRITLGQTRTQHPADDRLDAWREQAYTALSPYRGSLTPDGPLGPDSLPMLTRAVADVAQNREQLAATERARDDLIRRFLANPSRPGRLRPAELSRHTGLSPSRISQIVNPAPARG